MSVSPVARLKLGPPRSPLSEELAALVGQRDALRDRVDATDREQREANEDVARLSESLADLERRAAGGEKVSAKTRTEAEQALTSARLRQGEPWAERRGGGERAVRDHLQQMTIFVGQNFAALYDELAEDAEAVAARVDHACNELLAAYHERQIIDGRVTTLAAMVRAPEVGAVARTQAEAVAAAASALLQAGGEQAPLLRDDLDPRQPQQDEPPAEAEPEPPAEAEAEPVTAA